MNRESLNLHLAEEGLTPKKRVHIQVDLAQYLSPQLLAHYPESVQQSLVAHIEQAIHIGYLKGRTIISETPSILNANRLLVRQAIEQEIRAKLFTWLQENIGYDETIE